MHQLDVHFVAVAAEDTRVFRARQDDLPGVDVLADRRELLVRAGQVRVAHATDEVASAPLDRERKPQGFAGIEPDVVAARARLGSLGGGGSSRRERYKCANRQKNERRRGDTTGGAHAITTRSRGPMDRSSGPFVE